MLCRTYKGWLGHFLDATSVKGTRGLRPEELDLHLKGPEMTAETENLVLEHLHHIRGSIDALRGDISNLKSRIGRVEINLAQVQVALAEHSNRFDRLEDRLDRIERRLDLAEA